MALSEEAKAQMAANAERQRGNRWLKGEAELVDGRFGALTLGPAAAIEPGVEVWTREEARRNWHEDPLGGIVLAVDPGGRYISDDGEIVNRPAHFRCYDPLAPWPRKAFMWVSEEHVNRNTLAVVPPYDLARAVRRFCGEVCEHMAGRKGMLDHFEADLVTHAARLTSVLMLSR
jgi:hypothetical protein